jgi:hypothetical protein
MFYYFNDLGIDGELYYAKKDLKNNIQKAKGILQLYGVPSKEVEALIDKKIKL